MATQGYSPNGPGRRYAVTDCLDGWQEAFGAFGLVPHSLEPKFKNFTGRHYRDGAYTGYHTDETLPGFHHVRCNILVKNADKGGLPVLNGRVLELREGDMWLCFASLESHGSTPVFGGERVIFSYGALVAADTVERGLYE